MPEPNWGEIAAILLEVQAKIIEHPAWAKKSGPLPNDPSYDKDHREIAELKQKLHWAFIAIKQSWPNLDHSQQITLTGSKERPLGKPPKASTKKLKDVYELACETLRQLRDLEDNNSRVSLMDMLAEMSAPAYEHEQEVLVEAARHKAHLSGFDLGAPTIQNTPLPLIIGLLMGYVAIRSKAKLRHR